VNALGRWVIAAIVLLLGRGKRRPALPPGERIVGQAPAAPGSELVVSFLLLLAAALAVAFVVVYAGGANTQLLGLALGLSLAAVAAALVVTAFRLTSSEEAEEAYPEASHPTEAAEVEQIADESVRHLTRRKLLGLAAGGAGTALGVAFLTPLASLGPVLDTSRLRRQPWHRGVRLVDELGRVLNADEIELDTLHTAFPEGADPDELASPIVVVRLEPVRLDLPEGRSDWAPGGIVAYSKICTHAGCAVALYRAPHFEPTRPRPALVCPCHYSTFDPATGGTVLFGPAGRPLPQLPLMVGPKGELSALGGFSGPVGPSWWGVRK
jgi:ubiquinol-cytochrome c reductase iron-sulfur subunit